jgi:hypothetical protein
VRSDGKASKRIVTEITNWDKILIKSRSKYWTASFRRVTMRAAQVIENGMTIGLRSKI